jgi:OmcA/MtrC family decaheme c-type cytochrome
MTREGVGRAIAFLAWALTVGVASAGIEVTTLGGGGPRRNDCLATLQATGTAFPKPGIKARGVTCSEGAPCDQAPSTVGSCEYLVSLCVNAQDMKKCKPTGVSKVKLKQVGKKKGQRIDLGPLQAAVAALPLPIAGTACTDAVKLVVPLKGPNKKGLFDPGRVKLRVMARGSNGRVDKDQFELVCRPGTPTSSGGGEGGGGGGGGGGGEGTVPLPPPGAGLNATITGATVAADGTVTVDFTLVDDDGLPISPTGSSTSNPNMARLRFAIARLEIAPASQGGVSVPFTRYQNYILNSSSQPTYDSGGEFTTVDANAGKFTYTFKTMLPAGYPATLTHTIGAQVERTYAGKSLVANPIYDWVPAGGAVTTTRHVVVTNDCNVCHGTLAVHGGGRREVRLCQLCHTDQNIDPDTGNTVDFKVLIHKIHHGKDLPSIQTAVGNEYKIVGFNNSQNIYGKRVKFCKDGPNAMTECTTNADCTPIGTCVDSNGSTIKTIGVGFPQDIRNCTKCHKSGSDAANYMNFPSAAACASCHDNVNPGLTTTSAGPPGTGHVPAGAVSNALCGLCHTPTGVEFGLSVVGAHTIPAESDQLAGLNVQIMSATGSVGNPVVVVFKVTDGAGTPITDLAAASVSPTIVMSGTTLDLGDIAGQAANPTVIRESASSAMHNGGGQYTYTTTEVIPMGTSGSWRVGIEARRTVTIAGKVCTDSSDCDGDPCTAGHCEIDVNEATQNPVMDFSVDGSPVKPRREVVSIDNCGKCHGTFSVNFSIHGSLRNQTDYCVICHNANNNDFIRRRNAIAGGADPVTSSIHFKKMIHMIHTGEELAQKPYLIYGFGNTANDFGDILFPNDRRNCTACHLSGTQFLPLPAGVLPTRTSSITGSGGTATDDPTGSIPPEQAACLACHDDSVTAIHAATNTIPASGMTPAMEACATCHGEGKIAAVSEVHATD